MEQINKHHWKLLSPYILIFVLILSSFIYPLYSNVHAETVTISADSVNVRSGPGLTHEVMAKVHSGKTYPITGQEGDWIQLEISGEKGWIANWLVTKDKNQTEQSISHQISATVDSLRVRVEPNTQSEVIGSISKGETYNVIGTDGNWTEIKFNSTEGWVSSDYITSQTNKTENSGTQLRINTKILNVRNAPNLTSSEIIGKLNEGDIVSYHQQNNDWYQITYENTKAWISGDFVKPINAKEVCGSIEDKIPKKEMVVNASILNVRKSSSITSTIVHKVEKGAPVEVMEEDGDWAHIEAGGQSGWVASRYLTPPQAQPKITILHDGTNIRQGPSTDTAVVQRANKGDTYSVQNTTGDWYEITLSNGQSAYIAGWIVQASGPVEKVNRPGTEESLNGKTIVIDPGHGGKDNGTTGISGTLEKNLVYKTATKLVDKLESAGAHVVLTRNTDHYITLQHRVSPSHYHHADAFISLHYDSNKNTTVKGITTFYYDKQVDSMLAEAIHSKLIQTTGFKDRKAQFGNYHVLRENKQPSILLELGFLSNKQEEITVDSNTYQENVTKAIYDGLVDYFN